VQLANRLGSVQLSLFPELIENELVDNSTEESIDGRNDSPNPARTQDSGTLETPSAEDGRGAGAAGQLPQAVYAAQELTGNLLYELMVVQKMDYQFAWEIATREWAFFRTRRNQPELSFDPATLDPNQPLPTISA